MILHNQAVTAIVRNGNCPLWMSLPDITLPRFIAGCLMVALFLCGRIGSVRAVEPQEPSPLPTVVAAVGQPQRTDKVLLIGPLLDGKPDRSLREGVIDRLMRLGQELVVSESPEAQSCESNDCLLGFAQQQQATGVLRVEVFASAPRRYQLKVSSADATRGSVRRADSSCIDCSVQNLRGMVADFAAQLLTSENEPSLSMSKSVVTDPPPVRPEELNPLAVRPAPILVPPSRWTGSSVAAITALSVLTVISAVGTIALGTSNSPGKTDNQQLCLVDEAAPPTGPPPCVGKPALLVVGGAMTALSGLSALAIAIRITIGSSSHSPAPLENPGSR